MRIHDLFETLNLYEDQENIRLYRGDGVTYDSYDNDKTSSTALFGPGIYLTTNSKVARDYAKHDNDIVFTGYELRNGKSRTGVIRDWLYSQCVDIIEEEKNKIQLQLWSEIGDIREKLGYDNIKELHNAEEKLNQKYQNIWRTKSKQILISSYKQLIDDIKQSGDDYRIVKTTQGHYNIVKYTGNARVSVYDIPASYADNTYDADAPMTMKLIHFLRGYLINLYGEDKKHDLRIAGVYSANNMELFHTFDDWIDKVKTNPAPAAWQDFNFGGNGQYPSFDNFINHTHLGLTLVKSSDFWTTLIRELKHLGYVGFRFNGNFATAGVDQTAYVFWDTKRIDKMRSSSKKPNFRRFINDINPNNLVDV